MFGKEVAVDWAETEPVIPDSIMSRVKLIQYYLFIYIVS